MSKREKEGKRRDLWLQTIKRTSPDGKLWDPAGKYVYDSLHTQLFLTIRQEVQQCPFLLGERGAAGGTIRKCTFIFPVK